MASLVDTSVLVYCFDPRFPEKQRIARELLVRGMNGHELALAHQTLIEFVAVVTRSRRDLAGAALLTWEEAHREAEELVSQFPVFYPDEEVFTTALRGASAYGLSWYDAHLWAYAEVYGLPEILSEDFEHGRHYGSVRVVDPFLSASGSVYELPALYDADPSLG